jgi:hypothetical protein
MTPSAPPRVAITGIGVVSPYGVGRDRFWRHVSRGCSGTRAIVDFDASPFPCAVAAPVPAVSIDDAIVIADRAPQSRGDRAGRPDPRRYSGLADCRDCRQRSVARCRAAHRHSQAFTALVDPAFHGIASPTAHAEFFGDG